MANASAKRLAAYNKAQLAIHRRVSVGLYFLMFVFFKFSHRHVVIPFLLSTPAMVIQYLLEKWCNPKYNESKQMISPGHDFMNKGLIEYLKDVIYLTWLCLLLSVMFGLKAWLILLLIPVYVMYKSVGLIKAGLGMFRQSQPPVPSK